MLAAIQKLRRIQLQRFHTFPPRVGRRDTSLLQRRNVVLQIRGPFQECRRLFPGRIRQPELGHGVGQRANHVQRLDFRRLGRKHRGNVAVATCLRRKRSVLFHQGRKVDRAGTRLVGIQSGCFQTIRHHVQPCSSLRASEGSRSSSDFCQSTGKASAIRRISSKR